MTKPIRAAIAGVHGYVPDYILTNAELEKMVNTTDEWITTRTGIKERHILKGENQGSSVMGIEAVRGLLEKTHTDPHDIDLLICATITPDMPTPATGNIIAHAVGAVNAFSYDLQAACSGFVYAMVTGAQFIETGKCRKVVVVGVDKMSSMVDYEDRTTCILFGDGAGAVLLTPNEAGQGIMDSVLGGDGAGEEHLHQKVGGSRRPPSHATIDAKAHYLYQNGQVVFKIAVSKMAEIVEEIMQRNHLSSDDIAFIVPHQANQRILSVVAQRAGVSMDKVMINIDKFGNTTAATIPLCLWQYESQLKPGDRLILTAFGGGFTWGGAYVIWSQ
ncbi:MAG TPA: 3-oxoacyl-ACP synthase [Amoebophilaceae bacterium]|nr:3-oxoacyl-ACP synthase [Amoebophilaceae bacterium]